MITKKIVSRLLRDAKTQYWVFALGLMVPCVLMSYTEPHPWYVRILQITFGFGFFTAMMSILRRPTRGLYLNFIFVFFGAFQIALLWLFGNSPIAVDMFLNTLATNANEAGELLGNIIVGVILACGFYITLLIIAILGWKKDKGMNEGWRRKIRRRIALPSLVVSLCAASLLQLFTPFRLHQDIYPVNVTYNICLAVKRYAQLEFYEQNAKDFTFHAQATHAAEEQETYLFIIGETARSTNWSLYGYERKTTPHLEARKNLITYTDVLSQSNTTHKSVPLLLTNAEAADARPMYVQHSLIQAFREAGFHTIWISNQANNGSLIDHYSREADVRRYVREEQGAKAAPDDANLLTTLREVLAKDQHRKRLVVIHCYGSHFKYCERVPESFRKFQPCRDKQLKAKNREDLINAFDNTMLYNDMVVDSLMTIVDEMPADTSCAHHVMALFTSDHGEDIYDDERHNFLHASPIVSFFQMAVPLVIWCNEAYRQDHATETQQMELHRTLPIGPGREVFHTMLGAAGITCPLWQSSHALCSKEFQCGERLYLNDHNEATPLNRLHLTKNDYEQMRKRGMKTE